MLDFENETVNKYDVFVTELCDGNLAAKDNFSTTQRKDICDQLIQGLTQLAKAGKCHNDIKPENVL